MGITFESLVAFIAVIVAVVPILQAYNRRTRERLRTEQDALRFNRHVYTGMMCGLHLRGQVRREERAIGDGPLDEPYLIGLGSWEADRPVEGGVSFMMASAKPVSFLHSRSRYGSIRERANRGIELSYRKFACILHSFPYNPMISYARSANKFLDAAILDVETVSVDNIVPPPEVGGGWRGGVSIGCRRSSYFRSYDTCRFLEYVVAYTANRFQYRTDDYIPHRDKALSKLLLDPFCYRNRDSRIAVDYILLFRNVEGRMYIRIRRNEPCSACMTAVRLIDTDDLDPFRSCLMRGFIEETFLRSEPDDDTRFPLDPDPVRGNFDPTSMRALYCTMGMDPLSMELQVVGILEIDCSEPSFKRYVRRMNPCLDLTSGETMALSDVLSLTRTSYRGDSTNLAECTEVNLSMLMGDPRAMPAFRECMRYMLRHMDWIRGL